MDLKKPVAVIPGALAIIERQVHFASRLRAGSQPRAIQIIELANTADANQSEHHDERAPFWDDELQDMMDDYD